MNKERFVTLSLIILAAAASRLLPHPANVTPITAIALFAGAKFERKWLAFAVPLLAVLLSDAIIGFYSHMWVTYLAFALVVCIGFTLKNSSQRFAPIAGATLAGSVTFFLVTNCALLMNPGLYEANWNGVVESYVAGLPFFRNSLIGDAFYSTLLFGGFALAEKKFGWLRVNPMATA